jgi:hypothetical protein
MNKFNFFIFLVLGLISCQEPNNEKEIFSKYKPILMDSDKVTTDLILKPPQPNVQITQSQNLGNYLISLDFGLGIHIIDASDISHPKKIGFFQIPACIDFEIIEDKVFANNYQDLIVIDFSSPENPIIIKRESKVFDIKIKSPDGLSTFKNLYKIPSNTTIISYELL